MQLSKEIFDIVKKALKEDFVSKDITTQSFIPKDVKIKAFIMAKEKGVLCGIKVVEVVFKEIDKNIEFFPLKKDGQSIKRGEKVCQIKGPACKILSAERTALNFLAHLSGISTQTQKWIKELKDSKITLLDTRKTTPLLRNLEKYAVRVGGAKNHRMNLKEAVLLKENHIFILRRIKISKDELKKKILKIKREGKKVILEAHSLKDFLEFLDVGADVIMLDNFDFDSIKKACQLRDKICPSLEIEVSGNIDFESLKRLKKLPIQRISAGRLTHSVKWLDFSLEIEKVYG